MERDQEEVTGPGRQQKGDQDGRKMFKGEQAVYLCPCAKWTGKGLFLLFLIISVVQDFVYLRQAL